LAGEGADIIAVDLAGPLPEGVPYDSATPKDLAETERQIRTLDRRVVASIADIRELDRLREAVDTGVGELGRLDVIVANAGICVPEPWNAITEQTFRDVIDTNVVGTWNTVMAGAQHIIDGGPGRLSHFDQFLCGAEDAAVHGALHREQACGDRHGTCIRG
jgi:NAD(P)-dependent dehydrogenase (short-subunit alcohol dehydrogenase family)